MIPGEQQMAGEGKCVSLNTKNVKPIPGRQILAGGKIYVPLATCWSPCIILVFSNTAVLSRSSNQAFTSYHLLFTR